MESLSRRSMLRLASGAAGAGGVLGAGLFVPAHALRVRLRLDDGDVVAAGSPLTLRVVANPGDVESITVRDTAGLRWTRVIDGIWREIWVATPTTPGTATITVVSTGIDGSTQRDTIGYEVTSGTGPLPETGGPLIGMGAPADEWDRRVAEVGPGLSARRIFADLGDGATSQLRLVEDAHAAGLLPVISYKLGGDVARGAAGGLNGVAEQAADRLASFGRPTAVTVWHEPYDDISPAQYVAISRQLLPLFKRGELRVGPLLNGFLLDNQRDALAAFCPDDLFAIWDYFGIDTYESGTMDDPGERKPAERIPAAAEFVRSRGFDLPLGVGEYNGWSAASIEAAGEALLSTPDVWFGCVWNETASKGVTLSGDRLAAFRRTLTDPRAGSLPPVG